MGRGRQKAKQQKIARKLKYLTTDTDYDELAKELSEQEPGMGSPDPFADIDDQYADKDVDSAADDHASGAAEAAPATQEDDLDEYAKWYQRTNGTAAATPGAAAQIAANSAARHMHENKGVLDGITAARAAAWDAKVSPAALGPAVNTALQAAKDSGAFRGGKGDPGEKGEPGAPGKTPVRGTDYWTAADKQEIVNSVIAALPDGTEVSY